MGQERAAPPVRRGSAHWDTSSLGMRLNAALATPQPTSAHEGGRSFRAGGGSLRGPSWGCTSQQGRAPVSPLSSDTASTRSGKLRCEPPLGQHLLGEV